MIKTGLLFGSFNPVHQGHLMIANFMQQFTGLDELWFVLTPQSPFKTGSKLLPASQRLEMLKMATHNKADFGVCEAELDLPQPNYTHNTLQLLAKQHPGREFVLIMGSDNLIELHKWHRIDDILETWKMYVYKRHGYTPLPRWKSTIEKGQIRLFDAPQIEISSSFI
ncbi:MAG: nicotinate (nicotinamide) nucleotide adenylyltransferase, partial [Candidatus Delongbacteria bacterium]|nr:nicotinate (nicotinamide) nucleotide adenylyltransferase [Candidatus Delongbacteria bacterium]